MATHIINRFIQKLNLKIKLMAINLYIPNWFRRMKSMMMIIYAKIVKSKESNWSSIWEIWVNKKLRGIFKNFDSAHAKNANKMFITNLSIKIGNQMLHLHSNRLPLNILITSIKVTTKIVQAEIFKKLRNYYKNIFLFLQVRAN